MRSDGGWSSGDECLVLPNGTKTHGQCLDEYGQPTPDPLRFPDLASTAAEVNKRGLKLGLWTIRGVYASAVAARSKIKGTQYTVDALVDTASPGGGPNGSCLWAKDSLGVNMSHPAAQTYYDHHVAKLASFGIDFIKADCMM